MSAVYREYSCLQLDLPAVLLKLAEQISPATRESLSMSVLCKNGANLDVRLQKHLYHEEERIILDVSAADGHSVFDQTDEDKHRLDLGSVQSPVYLQNTGESGDTQTLPGGRGDAAGASDSQADVTTDYDTAPVDGLASTGPEPPSRVCVLEGSQPGSITADHSTELLQLTADNKHASDITNLDADDINVSEIPPQDGAFVPAQVSVVQEVAMVTDADTDSSQPMVVEFDASDMKNEILQEEVTEDGFQQQEVRTLSDMLASGDVIIKSEDSHDNGDPVEHIEAQVLDTSAALSGQTITILEKDGSLTSNHIQIEVKGEQEDGVLIDSSSVILLDTGNGEKPMEIVSRDDLGNFIVLNEAPESRDGQEVLAVADSEWWTAQEGDTVQDVTDSVDHLHQVQEIHVQDMDSPHSSGTKKPGVRRATRLPAVSMSTGEIALESSIQVQDVKDIPKVMMDINGFQCRICSKIFNSHKLISGHFSRSHQEIVVTEQDMIPVIIKDAFLCYICHQAFRRFDAVRKHLESVHKMEMQKRKIVRLISCPICFSKHSSYHTLRCHLSYKHRGHSQFQEALVSLQTQSYNQKVPRRQDCILLQCPWCQLNLTMKQFRHHVQTAHRGEADVNTVIDDALEAIKVQKLERYRKASKHCKICKRDFPMMKYYSHMRRVHQYSTKPLNNKCDQCGKVFGSSWHLKMHSLIHTDERGFKCEDCGNAFRSKYALQYHVNTVHLDVYRFVCDVCKRGFHSRRSRNEHHCDPTRKPRKKRCYLNRSGQLKQTQNSPKVEKRPKTPAKVEESQPDSMSISIDTPPTVPVVTPDGNSLPPVRQDKFLEVTESGLFKCKVCSKEFKSRMSVSTHLRRVHHISRTPIQEYKCDQCDKVFILESRLKTHLNIHEESSHQCTQCVKSFKDKYTLRNHIRVVHDREYTYSCGKCGRGFEKLPKLQQHLCQHQQDQASVPIVVENPGSSEKRKAEAQAHVKSSGGNCQVVGNPGSSQIRKVIKPLTGNDNTCIPLSTDQKCVSPKTVVTKTITSVHHVHAKKITDAEIDTADDVKSDISTPEKTQRSSKRKHSESSESQITMSHEGKRTGSDRTPKSERKTETSKTTSHQNSISKHLRRNSHIESPQSCDSKMNALEQKSTSAVTRVTRERQPSSRAASSPGRTPRTRSQPKWLKGYEK